MHRKKIGNKIVGVITFLFGAVWTWNNASLLYDYHNGHALYLIMYPDWVLILNIIGGLVGMAISAVIFFKQIKIWKLLFLMLFLYIIPEIMHFIYVRI